MQELKSENRLMSQEIHSLIAALKSVSASHSFRGRQEEGEEGEAYGNSSMTSVDIDVDNHQHHHQQQQHLLIDMMAIINRDKTKTTTTAAVAEAEADSVIRDIVNNGTGDVDCIHQQQLFIKTAGDDSVDNDDASLCFRGDDSIEGSFRLEDIGDGDGDEKGFVAATVAVTVGGVELSQEVASLKQQMAALMAMLSGIIGDKSSVGAVSVSSPQTSNRNNNGAAGGVGGVVSARELLFERLHRATIESDSENSVAAVCADSLLRLPTSTPSRGGDGDEHYCEESVRVSSDYSHTSDDDDDGSRNNMNAVFPLGSCDNSFVSVSTNDANNSEQQQQQKQQPQRQMIANIGSGGGDHYPVASNHTAKPRRPSMLGGSNKNIATVSSSINPIGTGNAGILINSDNLDSQQQQQQQHQQFVRTVSAAAAPGSSSLVLSAAINTFQDLVEKCSASKSQSELLLKSLNSPLSVGGNHYSTLNRSLAVAASSPSSRNTSAKTEYKPGSQSPATASRAPPVDPAQSHRSGRGLSTSDLAPFSPLNSSEQAARFSFSSANMESQSPVDKIFGQRQVPPPPLPRPPLVVAASTATPHSNQQQQQLNTPLLPSGRKMGNTFSTRPSSPTKTDEEERAAIIVTKQLSFITIINAVF